MKKILCSFSGGETSSLMAHFLLNSSLDSEIIYVFANTGQEDEKTLKFVNDCDKKWGLGVIWVEAVVDHRKMKGTRHRVTNFKNAKRDGSIFEDVVKKYGIPNKAYPHCTRELKLAPINSYAKSIGWNSGDFYTAIGIRCDEIDRVNKNHEKLNLFYPLLKLNISKKEVKEFWQRQSFGLDLHAYQGNCTWCWKKSYKKLFRLIKDDPTIFDVPKHLESKYGAIGCSIDTRRVFFRDNFSTEKLFQEAREPNSQLEMSLTNGCDESCEVHGDES